MSRALPEFQRMRGEGWARDAGLVRAYEERPLMYVAGSWTNRTSVRKFKEGEVNAEAVRLPDL